MVEVYCEMAVLLWKVYVVERVSRDEICLSGGKLGGNLHIHSSSQHSVDPCRGTFNQLGLSKIGFVFRKIK